MPFSQIQTGAPPSLQRDPSTGQLLNEEAWRQQSGLAGLGMGMPNEVMREGQSMTNIGPAPTGSAGVDGLLGPTGELAREPSMTSAPTFAPFDETSTIDAMALAREGSGLPLGATTSDATVRESSNLPGIKTPPPIRDASGQEINLNFGREPSGLGRGIDGLDNSGMLSAQSSQSTMREPSSEGIFVPNDVSREPSGKFRRESTQLFKVDDKRHEGNLPEAPGDFSAPEGAYGKFSFNLFLVLFS